MSPRPNSVALITGASRGLGATLAAFLAGQGYDLVLTARGAAELTGTAKALSHYRTRIVTLSGDVVDPGHRRAIVQAVEALGRLDLLINNASELGPSPLPALDSVPLPELRQVLEVNVVAPLALIQEALPLLVRSGGLIVNLSSDAAIGGYPGWGSYGASKAALDLISLTLAQELAGNGVAVVSVDPGDMRTRMHQAAFPGEDITDRPLPGVTVPFWAWLLGSDRAAISGRRFRAQADTWESVETAVVL
jgi:NAD(P)-dependent dehydrogenase (short-subunit alcohol dehydrogenase family)